MLRLRQLQRPRGLLALSLPLPRFASTDFNESLDTAAGGLGDEAVHAEVTKWRLEAAGFGGAEQAARLGLDEAHPVDHQLERRLRRAAGLVRPDGEQPLELPLVPSQCFEALADRRQQLDDRLAHSLLQVPVARAVEASLQGL